MYRLCVAAVVFLLTFPSFSLAQEEPVWLDYEDGMLNQMMSEGSTIVVHYTLDGCTACLAQEKTINRLRESNPAYEVLEFVRVDWDRFEPRAIVRDYDIFGRSTIMVIRTGGELDSLFAETSRSEIQRVMDLGLLPNP